MMPIDGKLITMPEAEQPTFPTTNVQVSPQGVKISILLAPGIELSTTLNEETMNQMMQLWIQTRKVVEQELDIVRHISRTRND